MYLLLFLGLFPSKDQLELLQVYVDYRLSRKVITQFWKSFNGATPFMSDDDDVEDSDEPEDRDDELSPANGASEKYDRKDIDFDDSESYAYKENVPLLNSPDTVLEHFVSIAEFRRNLEDFILRQGEPERCKLLNRRDAKYYRKARDWIISQRSVRRRSDAPAEWSEDRASMHYLMDVFRKRCEMGENGLFFLCNMEEKIQLAKEIHYVPLTFSDRYAPRQMAFVGTFWDRFNSSSLIEQVHFHHGAGESHERGGGREVCPIRLGFCQRHCGASGLLYG
jgi:hypothetical protein